MKVINVSDINYNKYFTFIKSCSDVAQNSTCDRSRCGSIIVDIDSNIIGKGYNSPPSDLQNQKRCQNLKTDYNIKVTDKTCCIHAEQRAIMDALINNPKKIKDSTLYFVRVDEDFNIKFSGEPYCTICSKMALDVGIKYFVLFREGGLYFYDTEEYNNLSFDYNKN